MCRGPVCTFGGNGCPLNAAQASCSERNCTYCLRTSSGAAQVEPHQAFGHTFLLAVIKGTLSRKALYNVGRQDRCAMYCLMWLKPAQDCLHLNYLQVQHTCKCGFQCAGGLNLNLPPHLKVWAWPLGLPFILQMVSRSRLLEDKEYSLMLRHPRLTWLLCDLQTLLPMILVSLWHDLQHGHAAQRFVIFYGCQLLQQAGCLAAVPCSPVHADQ